MAEAVCGPIETARRPRSVVDACAVGIAAIYRYGGIIAATVTLAACNTAAQSRTSQIDSTQMSQSTTLPADINFRVGTIAVEGARWREELPASIERHNGKVRLDGLPDHLNPLIIDSAKAITFVAALASYPKATLQALSGKELLLHSEGLMLSAVAPTRPATYSTPMPLVIEDVQGHSALARLQIQVDCGLARERSIEARGSIGPASAAVTDMEGRVANSVSPDPDAMEALSKARHVRSRLSHAWRTNAQALVQCPGADDAALADLKAAQEAVSKFGLSLGLGMP